MTDVQTDGGSARTVPGDFHDLALSGPIRAAIHAAGYREATPIQQQAIPHVLEGRDLLGCARTGTGKTAAFALPILERLLRGEPGRERCIRALVLAPTRELAAQIEASFARYAPAGRIRSCVVFGGTSKRPQISALRRGVDVLVATPGRLLDLLGEREVDLGRVETVVLDEADRMLDMGFVNDVRRILRGLSRERQTLLFSATMPPPIRELAREFLRDPVRIAVDPVSSTAVPVEQSVYFVEARAKPELLLRLLRDPELDRVLVFTRTKHGANRLVSRLSSAGVRAAAIHGNKSQPARERALEAFRGGQMRVVVATDIASRGIDVKDLGHVICFDLPSEPEVYVHRVGRTGRAGSSGIALSLCSSDEMEYLEAIERLTDRRLRRLPLPDDLGTAVAGAPLAPRGAARDVAIAAREERPRARPRQGAPRGGRATPARTQAEGAGGRSRPRRRRSRAR
jgi:ATP-dependent RNA helicase RhlE